MTAAELRKALEGVPDDMLVVTYEEGYLSKEVTAGVKQFAPKKPGQIEEHIWKYSHHPEGTVGVPYFLVA
jgi:hypothetical protein